MKKFAIISTVLIVLAAGVFGFSVYRYVSIENALNAATEEVSTEELVTVEATEASKNTNIDIPDGYNDNGIFSDNYEKAYKKIKEMSNEQLVGSLIMGTCKSDSSDYYDDITKYNLSSYWLSSDCFANKSESDIKEMVKNFKQRNPGFIVAVDEEGGMVTAVTDHDAYLDCSFDAIKDLYASGGLEAVEKMELDKLKVLKDAGIALNLAPIVDLSKEEGQVMYSQALGADAKDTSDYASYVVKNFQEGGVSTCLRHFPGYGNITRSSDGTISDDRSKKELENSDFLPFKAGIDAKCNFVMVANFLAKGIDNSNIASLSPEVHKVLKEELSYTGLIITDNLDNDDYSMYSGGNNQYVQAILAGNDMIIADNYGGAYDKILEAVEDGTIPAETLEKAAMRVAAYKYSVGLLK